MIYKEVEEEKPIVQEKDTEQLLVELLTFDAPQLVNKLDRERREEKSQVIRDIVKIAKEFMADEDHKEFDEKVEDIKR